MKKRPGWPIFSKNQKNPWPLRQTQERVNHRNDRPPPSPPRRLTTSSAGIFVPKRRRYFYVPRTTRERECVCYISKHLVAVVSLR